MVKPVRSASDLPDRPADYGEQNEQGQGNQAENEQLPNQQAGVWRQEVHAFIWLLVRAELRHYATPDSAPSSSVRIFWAAMEMTVPGPNTPFTPAS